MKGITLRHFPEIELGWLEEFKAFLMTLNVTFRPLEESEVYEELVMPPVFTVEASLQDVLSMNESEFQMVQYGLLGLMEQAFTQKEFGFYKSEDVFVKAMPLGFFLQTAQGERVKLYFRNTQIRPLELEDGLAKLPRFLQSHSWDTMDYNHVLGAIAFFDQNNWQFPN